MPLPYKLCIILQTHWHLFMDQFDRLPSATSRLWVGVFCLFLFGLTVRVSLLSLAPASPNPAKMEPINIAISLVHHGTYADPFNGPTGPSAHCLPLHPLLVALIIRMFGLGFAGSRALSYSASAAASLGYALLPVLARNCSLGRSVGIWAGIFGAAAPINFWCQTSGVFEASYTLLAFVVLACVVARNWHGADFTASGGALCGVVAAVSALLNSGTIPILAVWFVCAFLWFRGGRISVLRYFAIAFLIVLIALTPWALRNKHSLGTMIFTRSNFGLELQLSNNPIAHSDEEFNVRNTAWGKLHPYNNPDEREKVRWVGEVAYNRDKLKEAVGWIRANLGRFLQLTLGRIALFWFPRMLRFPQTFIQACIMILAIAGLIRLWKARPDIALLLGSACFAYSLVYVLIEVSPRYRFPIEGYLLLLSSFFLSTVLAPSEGKAI